MFFSWAHTARGPQRRVSHGQYAQNGPVRNSPHLAAGRGGGSASDGLALGVAPDDLAERSRAQGSAVHDRYPSQTQAKATPAEAAASRRSYDRLGRSRKVHRRSLVMMYGEFFL